MLTLAPPHILAAAQVHPGHAPVTDQTATACALTRLLAPGNLPDGDLDRRIRRLEERFVAYAATVPFGIWAPGLIVTGEMRGLTEQLLPLNEVRRAFCRLFRLTLGHVPDLDGTPLTMAATWLDCLERLDPPFRRANPAALLARLAADDELRCRFLFSLFVPRRHGASTVRYPGQAEFLRHWLRQRERLPRQLRCLDVACGAGEGTYGLAQLLLAEGFTPGSFRVLGASRDPIEIFAATHGLFPHDPDREAAHRRIRAELQAAGAVERIRFIAEDLLGTEEGASWDVILCNGILGGPLMHEDGTLKRAVTTLAGRLTAGGIILAADRFHDGWKRRVPPERIAGLFAEAGLTVAQAGEGVAGIRTG